MSLIIGRPPRGGESTHQRSQGGAGCQGWIYLIFIQNIYLKTPLKRQIQPKAVPENVVKIYFSFPQLKYFSLVVVVGSPVTAV